jgi:hypothetical protein
VQELKPQDRFVDKHGRLVRGQLLFLETDLKARFGGNESTAQESSSKLRSKGRPALERRNAP